MEKCPKDPQEEVPIFPPSSLSKKWSCFKVMQEISWINSIEEADMDQAVVAVDICMTLPLKKIWKDT